MRAVSSRTSGSAPGGGRYDEAGDATRRTRLANERTYLAWWRTGLTSLAVGLGAGRIAPALTSGAAWPYAVAGATFAVLGLLFIAYAFVRYHEVERAIARGEFAHPHDIVLAVLAVIGVVLAIVVLAIVVLDA